MYRRRLRSWTPRVVCLCAPLLPIVMARGDSPVREFRGVWLDKAELCESRDELSARLDRLARAGFNTVYIATQVRGCVIYPGSKLLPQYEPAKELPVDHLAWVIEAAHSSGLRVEAWTEFGFYAYWTKDASSDQSRGAVLDGQPRLAAIDASGNAVIHHPTYGDFYALCPANPRSHDVLIDLYTEMLQRYRFEGLHLDRVRFPDAKFCHCEYCRVHFLRDTGIELSEAQTTDTGRTALDRWRKQQVNAFVERLSRRFRSQFPGRALSSAVVPPSMIDDKAQDWPEWIESGWVDAVAVMLYAEKIDDSLAWIRKRLPADAPVCIGVDAAAGAERLIGQIEQARAGSFPGVVVWYSGSVDPHLSKLAESVFAQPAVATFKPASTSNDEAP